ncbi:family 43 glycosylhydrolase [Nocardioides sp. HM23]|uniref:family 43 glycosylhydrolase n=1 Tax=Nocardioides bizhenqiangii TaxID=3095076 RepID=UPI002ACA8823|nr:family 43 glycosylhydrolase [Nocardioides sp. HM23]MDZ5619831.1 family 43 glycosylhydrolase [Nocardioides sp. HM23]
MLRRLRLAVGAAALAAATAAPALVPAEAAAARYPDPIITTEKSGDPSVVETRSGRVLVTTGPRVRRARWDPGEGWRWISPALSRLPRWAVVDDVWAADLARIGDRWVLYYAARVRGLGKGRRCIGVATAPTAYGAFRPIDARPLVCHARADTPRAWDTVPRTPGLPRRGVIDPSYFLDPSTGTPYLLYKTDGRPSSIRLLPLGPRGVAPAAGATSSQLVRADWVMENPVVLRRGGFYHLFTSEDIWSRCSYRTVWRRSADLATWPTRPRRVLLSRATTDGLCGPGGADVLVVDRRPLMYFHGWVRNDNGRPPEPPFVAGGRGPAAHRVLYGARLRFVDDVPTLVRYLARRSE